MRIKTVWEMRTYDVWGNAEDGYDVNDSHVVDRGLVLWLEVRTHNAGTPSEFTSATPTDRQLQRVFGTRASLDVDGDDVSVYVNRERDAYPLGVLSCVSHVSLSPIQARGMTT